MLLSIAKVLPMALPPMVRPETRAVMAREMATERRFSACWSRVTIIALVEPLKMLFKDEVRACGAALGLPDSMVYRQPFPGPGLGVRCLGAITRDRLEALRESDAILREEFAAAGLAGKVWQYFTVVPDFKSVGVRDGARTFDWPVILRAVNTVDAMTATVVGIPYDLLGRITERITTEVAGVNRVLYDLTPKPTGTIEWE